MKQKNTNKSKLQELQSKIEALDELKSKCVEYAKLYNAKAKELKFDAGLAVVLGNGEDIEDYYNELKEDDISFDENYSYQGAHYLLRPHGKNYWFPSDLNC